MSDNQRAVEMLEKLAEDLGMEMCCLTCFNYFVEDDGSDYPVYHFPVCGRFDSFSNLKSFPFKKHKQCWRPDFWMSGLASEIRGNANDELVGQRFSDKVHKVLKEVDALLQNESKTCVT